MGGSDLNTSIHLFVHISGERLQSTIEQTVAHESLGDKVLQPGRSVLDQCLDCIVASIARESLHILEDRHDERPNLR